MLLNIFKIRKRLELEGLNINRLIAKLKQKEVSIFNMQRLAYNRVYFEIFEKDLPVFFSIEEVKFYNITDLGKVGKGYNVVKNFSRIGIMVGTIVVILFNYFTLSKIRKIDILIEGADVITKSHVEEMLVENNINIGQTISKINSKELEDLILKNIKEASLVVVEQKGVNLNITLKVGEGKKENYNGNIIAGYDGIVQNIRLGSGLLKVNVGDIVTKGQTLISAGTVGDLFLEANGTIVAKTWIDGEAYGLTEYTTLERTGQSYQNIYLELFKKKYFFKSKVNPYAYFETELHKNVISENNLLPIKKYVEQVYETIPVTKSISIDNLIEDLKEKAYNNAKGKLEQNMEEGNVTYSVINEGNYYKVICSIETMIDIAQRETAEY